MRSVNTSPYILKIKTASGKNRIHWGQYSYIFTLQKNLEDCTVPEGVEPCSSSEREQTKLFLIRHIILVSGSGTWIYSSCYSRRCKLSRSCRNYTEILGLQVRRQIELWVEVRERQEPVNCQLWDDKRHKDWWCWPGEWTLRDTGGTH